LTAGVLAKEAFWRRLQEKSTDLSEWQKKIINRLLDGFEGKLTTEKWAKLAKVSHGTALRDIQDLIHKGILTQEQGGGRSTALLADPRKDGLTCKTRHRLQRVTT
jgi:Fic family protein